MNGNSHILVCLFPCPFRIYCPLFWTFLGFLSSVMVQPSPHRTPKDMSGAVFVAGKMSILLASLYSPVSVKVDTCVDSIALTSVSLSSVVCPYLTGLVMGVSILAKFMLSPE